MVFWARLDSPPNLLGEEETYRGNVMVFGSRLDNPELNFPNLPGEEEKYRGNVVVFGPRLDSLGARPSVVKIL